MTRTVPLDQANQLPIWRRPLTLLFVMAVAMPLSFATWSALLNNFVVEVAKFDGLDIGILHTVREIPGFLAIGVIVVLLFMREQTLALLSLTLLGVATAVTAWFPTVGGLMIITLLSSIGFHYYETVNQSLQLQWLPKDKAPQILGLLLAAASGASLIAYVAIVMTWKAYDLSYNFVYLVSGALTLILTLYCFLAFPNFESPNPQTKKFVLRRRYWLYYALQFMSGARRQIFVVFAGFMMVERFGFEVHQLTGLYLINLMANMVLAPLFGRAVHKFGERNTLIFEYVGLVCVFMAYGGIYWFGWGVVLASALYVIDHLFFSLALALKTYFQKISDPGDIAPTAAVAFTINHIAAVVLPAVLGFLWLVSPGAVFAVAVALAAGSLALALMIPRHPEQGYETIFASTDPTPAE